MHNMHTAAQPQLAGWQGKMCGQAVQRNLRPHRKLCAHIRAPLARTDMLLAGAATTVSSNQPVKLMAYASFINDRQCPALRLVNMGQIAGDTGQAGGGIQRIMQQAGKRGAAETCIMLDQWQLDQGCPAVESPHGDVVKAQRPCFSRISNAETGQCCPAIRGDLQAAGKWLVGGSCKQQHIMASPTGCQ